MGAFERAALQAILSVVIVASQKDQASHLEHGAVSHGCSGGNTAKENGELEVSSAPRPSPTFWLTESKRSLVYVFQP